MTKKKKKWLATEHTDTAWDIRVEGKLNKNNLIFKDKKYLELYQVLKKENDLLKKCFVKLNGKEPVYMPLDDVLKEMKKELEG